MEENRFCFVAIVKNECHVIKRCIDSIANIATSYLICDTGSTDDTVNIIENYMKEKGIPGEVIHKEWVDYAFNKSYLMNEAYTNNKSQNAKYIIWHDADEVFLTNINDDKSYLTKKDADEFYNWLENSSEPITYIFTHYDELKYPRWNIVRNNQLYEWRSPKHEYLHGTQDNRSKKYYKFILYARHEGNASRDGVERNKRDVQLYINYIEKNGGPEMCKREVFYLAQEYESFDRENAIKYHLLKVSFKTDWIQEQYISYLRLGNLSDTETDKIKYWEAGFKLIPHRLECIHAIVKFYIDKDKYESALIWAVRANESRTPEEEDLFVNKNIYSYLFDLNYSLAAYYSGKYQLANDINQKNIYKNKGKNSCELLLNNQKFIEKKIREQKDGIMLVINENHKFPLNPNNRSYDMRPTIIVIDDFYKNPDEIRNCALAQEYPVKGNYPGARTKAFATDEMKQRFESIIGKKITYWPVQYDSYNGAYQYTTDKNKSWIHRDLTDYAGIIYLTPNAPVDSGTVFYKHKVTNSEYAITDNIDKTLNNDSQKYDAWEIVDVIGNKYNRCILFTGRRSHKSNVYFGSCKEDGRLFQTFFFDTEI